MDAHIYCRLILIVINNTTAGYEEAIRPAITNVFSVYMYMYNTVDTQNIAYWDSPA